jgi:hypothetical protein
LLNCLDNALTAASLLSATKDIIFQGGGGGGNKASTDELRALVETTFDAVTKRCDLLVHIKLYNLWEQQQQQQQQSTRATASSSSSSSRAKGLKRYDSTGNDFARKYGLDVRVLKDVQQLRRQFHDHLVSSNFIRATAKGDGEENEMAESSSESSLPSPASSSSSRMLLLTTCCFVSGLSPNIAFLQRPARGGGGKLITKEGVKCYPSRDSFQADRIKTCSSSGKDAYVTYVSTHRSIGPDGSAGGTSIKFTNFVNKYAILLFSGLQLGLEGLNMIVVDSWLKFKVGKDKQGQRENCVLLFAFRKLLDDMMLNRIVNVEQSAAEEEKFQQMLDVVEKLLLL